MKVIVVAKAAAVFCSPRPVENARRLFPLRFGFVLDRIPWAPVGPASREAKRRRLQNSICDTPAALPEGNRHILACAQVRVMRGR